MEDPKTPNSESLQLNEEQYTTPPQTPESSNDDDDSKETTLNKEVSGTLVICSETDTPSELIGKQVKGEEDAYDMYNDYAFQHGFSVRRSKTRKRAKGESLSMRQFLCSAAGVKTSKGKCYKKLNTRTNCKAMIRFHIDANGLYTVTKHEMQHNHMLVPENKRHLLRSQRDVKQEDINYLLLLVESGIKLSDALRALKKEKGGTPLLGFITKDAYNRVAKERAKKLEGSDCMKLLNTLRERRDKETDFYYHFDVDDEGSLSRFFWRDARMKENYQKFGDLVVHDTTYRTNRYDMICGPFIGINHHAQNVMFGCGFLVDETTESFVWLFDTFLKSMDGVQPTTIMTDQAFAMAAAIKIVFPQSNHRICLWHLLENSKKHIGHLRAKEGFVDMFKYVLMYCDSQAEFEFYWKSMMTKYECEDNDWLKKLYKKKKKWCVPFTKDFFSAAVLSSQRSEVTNKCVSQKLSATSGLMDFYHGYGYVTKDWENKELGEDNRCQQGNAEMIANFVGLLDHARSVYTIEAYHLFQEQFMKSWQFHQNLVPGTGTKLVYHVGKPETDLIQHVVTLDLEEDTLVCTCKLFTELGILCSHILRVMTVNCKDKIPARYIVKRWTKDAIRTTPEEIGQSSADAPMSISVWRTQMCRKFNDLVTISTPNEKARGYLQEGYLKIKEGVENQLTQEDVVEESSDQNAENQPTAEAGVSETAPPAPKEPKNKRKAGTRNVRIKPKIEKIYNVVAGKRAKAFRARNHTKQTVQSMVEEQVRAAIGQAYLTHPANGGPLLTQHLNFDFCPSTAQTGTNNFPQSSAFYPFTVQPAQNMIPPPSSSSSTTGFSQSTIRPAPMQGSSAPRVRPPTFQTAAANPFLQAFSASQFSQAARFRPPTFQAAANQFSQDSGFYLPTASQFSHPSSGDNIMG